MIIKPFAICFAVMLLFAMCTCIGYAEAETWHCISCDADRDTAYCPICGAKRPDSEYSVWQCPTCGKEMSADDHFCPDDGTARRDFLSSWTKRKLVGEPVTVKPFIEMWYDPNDLSRQAYFGPDKNNYPGAGSFKPAMVTSAKALFREGNYVLVDLLYSGSKKIVYFYIDSLQDVPVTLEISTLESCPAKVVNAVTAMTGPGPDYEIVEINEKKAGFDGRAWWMYNDEEKSGLWGSKHPVIVEPETDINVFFEYNGWVFTEFSTARGEVRAWLPADAVVK